MTNQYDFLNTLKAGDEVIYRWGTVHSFYATEIVAKTTKTQIVLEGGARFRKIDGCGVGDSYNRIMEANDENMAIIDGRNAEKRRVLAARKIQNTRLDQLSEAALTAILAIIDGELDTNGEN